MAGSPIRRLKVKSIALLLALDSLITTQSSPAMALPRDQPNRSSCSIFSVDRVHISRDSRSAIFFAMCPADLPNNVLFEYEIPSGKLLRRERVSPGYITTIGYENDGSFSWISSSFLSEPGADLRSVHIWNMSLESNQKSMLGSIPDRGSILVTPSAKGDCFLLRNMWGQNPPNSYFYVYSGKKLVSAGDRVGFFRPTWDETERLFKLRQTVSGLSSEIFSVGCKAETSPVIENASRTFPEDKGDQITPSKSGQLFVDVKDRDERRKMSHAIELYRMSPLGLTRQSLETGSYIALDQKLAISDDETIIAIPDYGHIDVFDVQKSTKKLGRIDTGNGVKTVSICPNKKCIVASFDDHLMIYNVGEGEANKSAVQIVPR